MIQRLYIKDFAIINEIELILKDGFTVITGETGSGKSILLEALSVSLGAKTDKIMVRNGTERALVETEFIGNTFRRLLSKKGRSKAYQNDEPITISELIKANETTVDFHGQHDQQLGGFFKN
jgi:DNA repair protein RecN (Recombination protein N)